MLTVSVFIVLLYLFRTLSFHKTVALLKIRYNNTHLRFRFFLWTFHILFDKKEVKTVLSSKESKLSYFNNAFNASHGLTYTINSINCHNKYFSVIHTSLKKAIMDMMDTNYHSILFDKSLLHLSHLKENVVNINTLVSNMSLDFWAKFSFGYDVNVEEYNSVRYDIISILQYTFYDTFTARIPIIGTLNCTIRRYLMKKKINHVLHRINKLSLISSEGFVKKFTQHIDESLLGEDFHGIDKLKLGKIKSKILLNNIFLSFLVYDSINNLLINIMINKMFSTDHDFNDILKEIGTIDPRYHPYVEQRNSFLFPIRIKKLGENVGIMKKGDYCFVDLLSSQKYFSYGPKMCVGYDLSRFFVEAFLKKIKEFHIIPYKNNSIKLHSNYDTPFVLSDIYAQIVKKDIRYTLQYIPYEGINFYDICSLYYKNNLMCSIGNIVAHNISHSTFDVIVSPEAGGLPFAGLLQKVYNKPLIMIRKEGKYKETTITKEYVRGYNTEHQKIALPLHYKSQLEGKKALLVDISFGSGGTNMACIKLLKEFNCNVEKVVVMVKHSYCTKDNMNQEYLKKFMDKTLCIFYL